MIAVGYARRSKKTDENTVSIVVQREQIAQYCKRQNFDLRRVLVDDGVSGRKRERFDRLDEALKEFEPCSLVVYHLDRLARDHAGLGDFLRTLEPRGITLHEAAGGGKLDTKRAISRMINGIRGVTDQYYAEMIGERTAEALESLKQEGKRYSNIPPFGYRFYKGYLVADQEEQRGLIILRECLRAGLGARRALRVLQARQFTGRQSLGVVYGALKRLEQQL